MKMIAGAASLALVNRSRTREAPTPTIASMNSDAEIEKNAACASPATARASSVLPVPGRARRAARRGACARRGGRSARGFAGSRRSPSARVLASSIPATSAKVTRIVSGSTRRACERPKLPSAPIPPPALAARRASSTKRPTISSVGPKPSSSSASSEVARGRRLGVDLDALFLQQRRELAAVPERRDLRSRTASSASPSCRRRVAQLGLEGALDGVALGGDRADLAALTCSRKYGLNGTVTRCSPWTAGKQHREPS